MADPVVNVGCVANLFARQMHFLNAGDKEEGHTHPFDHLTLLAHGSVKVTVEGVETVFRAPQMIYIHAEHVHLLEALEPNTVAFCIHALRDKNGSGNIIDPASVPAGVSARDFSQPVYTL